MSKTRTKRTTIDLASFQALGRAERLKKLQGMEPAKQREVLSQLDPEAAKLFEKLEKITAAAVDKGEAALTEAPAEKAEPEYTPPPAVKMFEVVRQIMQAVSLNDFRVAYDLVKKLVKRQDLLFKARSLLVPTGLDIGRLYRHSLGEEDLDAGEPAQIIARINERLSDVIAYAAVDEEALASDDYNVIDQIEVNLPEEVTEPVVLENITLLVKPDRHLAKQDGVRSLASGVFLVDCRLLGIPTEVPEAEREQVATVYALTHLGAAIFPTPLTRPDSDGVWYPLFTQRFIAEEVQFPDQIRRYYGSTTALSEVAAAELEGRLTQLRSARADFEEAHAELFEQLLEARRAYEDADSEARELGRAFAETYLGASWTQRLETITAQYRRDFEYELSKANDDLPRRLRAQQAYTAKVRKIKAEQLAIVNLRLLARTAKATVDRLTTEIDERRRLALNPYAGLADKLRNPDLAA